MPLRGRPAFDPELEAAMWVMNDGEPPRTITPASIPRLRAMPRRFEVDSLLAEWDVEAREVSIRSYDGAELVASVLTATGRTGPGPGIYYVHGGGMISGDRWTGIPVVLPWLRRHNAFVVTLDYRLAPEHPDPTPVEDCYAGLLWVADNADELGLDPDRLVIAGGSAGAGIAAGLTLMARDRNGPGLCAQLLRCPMLDDRDRTVSAQQVDGVGVWDRVSNRTGWGALLGDRRGTGEVSIYTAPSRAADLSGLPQAYLDCGSVEVFRDEILAYAQALWASGVQAELHVWAGGFHGFDQAAPHAAVSRSAIAARDDWMNRVLGAGS